MKTLHITIDSDYCECDCCGSFYYATATLYAGNETYTIEHDGHFGGGYWDGSDDTLLYFLIAHAIGATSFIIDHEHYNQDFGDMVDVCTISISKESISLKHPSITQNISVDISDHVFIDGKDWWVDDSITDLLLDKVCELYGYEYTGIEYKK